VINDFYDWKKHPITEVVFSELRLRKEALIAELVAQTASISQPELAEKAGAIKVLEDLLNITVEDLKQETE
jgi:hypothetical protein